MNKTKTWTFITIMFILCFQWWLMKFNHVEFHPPLSALFPGLAIFAAAFILSWAAELAQLDIPQTLALAFLALIAVLPEYAVDMYFAWTAAKKPEYIAYATANMTGSNRLLIGLGWATVVFVYWFKTKKKEVVLTGDHSVEVSALFFATLYSFIIPIKGTISIMDSAVLLLMFVWYMIRASKTSHQEPELAGPAELIARLPKIPRRTVTVLLFLLAGFTIYISAEAFAEGLLATGRKFGIEEFLLVQWLAPLASESPEFIVAIIFALKVQASASIGTLVSSKVNQWTLLISMLPLAFSISGGHITPMVLDERQREEILLTAAQSLFALVVIANLSFSIYEAIIIAGLFITQLFFPQTSVRYAYSAVYMLLAILWFALNKSNRQAIKNMRTYFSVKKQ